MTTTKKKTDKKADFKKLVRSIERSNKTFDKADQATKIMMVAKDVLALLDLKRIKAKHGEYLRMPINLSDEERQVSDLLKAPGFPVCNVCAIGAAMLTSTLRLNDVVMRAPMYDSNYFSYTLDLSSSHAQDINTSIGMSKRAREVFSHSLLRVMEEAFDYEHFGYDLVPSGEKRLRAIYENLIDNKGKRFTWYRSNKDTIWSL